MNKRKFVFGVDLDGICADLYVEDSPFNVS
jgi:hypothetical protein